MCRLKLPGSSLLDRCIGRSTFQYTQAIKITPFAHNLSYDSYIKTLSKYQPKNQSHSWIYTTPFGRLKTCRLNLGSSKRTICLHSDQLQEEKQNKDNDTPTNVEVYEYCCGSIRNSLFTIQSTSLIPSKLSQLLLDIQYRFACYFAEKHPHSQADNFFDALYRGKLMDCKTFTSTQSNFFPKWCSSISLVRVLKAKTIDINLLIENFKKEEDNPSNKLKGKSNINISKDINHEIEQSELEAKLKNEGNEGNDEYATKDEYQSDILRYYSELSKFDTNYECNEMYLVLSTRYALSSSSLLNKLLFLPHWITVKLLSNITHENVLKDLANNLDFVAMKNAANNDNESDWHKPRNKTKV